MIQNIILVLLVCFNVQGMAYSAGTKQPAYSQGPTISNQNKYGVEKPGYQKPSTTYNSASNGWVTPEKVGYRKPNFWTVKESVKYRKPALKAPDALKPNLKASGALKPRIKRKVTKYTGTNNYIKDVIPKTPTYSNTQSSPYSTTQSRRQSRRQSRTYGNYPSRSRSRTYGNSRIPSQPRPAYPPQRKY